jgi:nucleotide-binding universal stress UspA family protein
MPYHYHISVGAPAEVIANYAAVEKINQIVMCKLGSGGNLRSRLLGSVVTDVLRLVDCPVLVVS